MIEYPWSNLLAVEDPLDCCDDLSKVFNLMFSERFPIKNRITKSLNVHKTSYKY